MAINFGSCPQNVHTPAQARMTNRTIDITSILQRKKLFLSYCMPIQY